MGGAYLNETTCAWAKLALACTAATALLLERSERARLRRWSAAALPVIGVLSLLALFNFGAFHFGGRIHLWDAFHHAIGAKYLDELGYEGLYPCVALADAEAGVDVATRPMRDLRSRRIASAGVALGARDLWRSRFSEARWRTFKGDVDMFRRRFRPEDWVAAQTDHGFNASPAWAMVARPLFELGADGGLTWSRVRLVSLADPVLLVVGLGAVTWAFGLRAASMAALVLGTYAPAGYEWTGGSLLRWDWLCALLVGVATCRRGRFVAGGALLGWAPLSRVFPAMAIFGVGLALAVGIWRRRPTAAAQARRVLAGALLSLVVLGVTSGSVLRPGAWTAFATNVERHGAWPSANRMGLATVLGAATLERPFGSPAVGARDWEEAQRGRLESRWWLWAGLALIAIVALARALEQQPIWAAPGLGLLLVPVGPALACYYHAFVAAVVLLEARRRQAGVLVALLLVGAGALHLLPRPLEQRFVAHSWLLLVTFGGVLAAFAARAPGQNASEAAASSPQVSGTGPRPSRPTPGGKQ